MKLTTYLAARRESQNAFSRRAGVDQRTINRVARGAVPGGRTAEAIIRASRSEPTPDGGTVTLEDLVPRGVRAARG